MLKGKRVFVSGAAGVIGREMIPKLLKRGAIVFAADRKSRPQNFPKGVIYRQGDLNYISKKEIEAFKPEVLIHLAASFERSTESYEFFEENFHDNVLLSHHLISIFKDLPSLKKVIFPSSYLIYSPSLYSFDSAQDEPTTLKETDPIFPRNLTGSAKLNHEIELSFLRSFKPKVQVVLARIYRGYGRNSRDVISRFVRSLLKDEPISVYKKENLFDYIFSEDSAEGLLRLAESKFSGIINLGSGQSTRVSEVIATLKVFFPKMKIKYEDMDIPFEASRADTALLEKVTSWKPENSVKDGIKKIIEFEKKRKGYEIQEYGNVLVTSASKKIPMIEALKTAARKISPSIKVFAGDLDPEALSKYFADEFYKMPRLTDEAFDAILAYLKKKNISAVIPSRDGELEYWAKHKKILKKNKIHVMVSDSETISRSVDKLKFSKYLIEKNFPAIPAYSSVDQVKSPRIVVKERFGAGSASLGIDLTVNKALDHAKGLLEPIFQPFIKGEEFSVDLYVDLRGHIKGVIARKRSLVVNGESQITEVIADKKLEELCINSAKALGIRGHAIFQIIKQGSKYHLIECNARFGGASTISLSSGLDSFYWFLLEANGENIDSYPFIKSEVNLKQVRYPKDILL